MIHLDVKRAKKENVLKKILITTIAIMDPDIKIKKFTMVPIKAFLGTWLWKWAEKK